MVEQAVIERLNAITELEDRVYMNTIPQAEATPFAAVFVISKIPSNTKEMASRMDYIRLQVSIFARTYYEAATIRDLVRTSLDRYETTLDHEAFRFWFEDDRGDYDQGADLQSITMDFMCSYNRIYIS